MLQKAPAVQSLQDGCRRLGLPIHTAEHLVQFLTIKRQHDCITGGQGMRMSPGAAIDRLWHWMLLNTAVSSQVHELVGGVVEHRGTDAEDLTEEEKLVQRLYSMNIMRLEGREPDLELWLEPGTLLSTTHETSKVPCLEYRPGGGKLFSAPTLNTQQRRKLTQALAQLYSSSAPAAGGTGPAAAVPPPAAERPAASAGSRKRGAAQQPDMFRIIVQHHEGTVAVPVCPTDTVLVIMQRCQVLAGVALKQPRLIQMGMRLPDSYTVAKCGLQPDDVVAMFDMQEGC